MLQSVQVMDYGYPQFTEAQILQEFIKTDSYRMEVGLQQQQLGGQQQQCFAAACSSAHKQQCCGMAGRANAYLAEPGVGGCCSLAVEA